MSFRVGQTTLRVHAMLPLLWLFAFLTGGGAGLLPALLAFALHESGHLLFSRFVGMRVEEIEITPYGGVIAVENLAAAPPLSGFLLAAGGPLFSLLGCLVSASLLRMGIGFSFARDFARSNLLLLLVNLLPALPLDGGRMARSLLMRWFPYTAVTKALTAAGYALGGLLCALSLVFALQGRLNLAPAFAGFYLMYAAALEGRQGAARYVTALIARRQRLERRETLPVQWLAAGGSMPVRSLLRHLSVGKYHVIYVLSADGMERLGMVEEKELCEAALSQEDTRLSELIGSQKSSTKKARAHAPASRS